MEEENQRHDYEDYGLRIEKSDRKNPLSSSQVIHILLLITCLAVLTLLVQRAIAYDSAKRQETAISVVNSSIAVSLQDELIRQAAEENVTVNVNTADIDELCRLKGIGETKAQAIIDYRTENGPFTYREELMKVSGIGEGTFAQIAPQIILQDTTEPLTE